MSVALALAETRGQLVFDARGADNDEVRMWRAAGRVAAANLGLEFVERPIAAPECYTPEDFS